jgi:dipeptidyl-peptidase-3
MAKAVGFYADSAFISGTGAGQPLGVLNDPALISITSTAGTGKVGGDDLVGMLARLHPACYANAIWLVSSEAMGSIWTLKNGEGDYVYHPEDVNGQGRLLGLPVRVSEHCSQVGTIGENLPNEKEIHEKYGTKSFIFTGSTRAFARATGTGPLEDFAWSPEEIALGKKYDDEATDLKVALHEVIGHGSGKLNPRLTRDASFYLKECYSTLEEARADLMALWSVADPKMRELGLISSPEVVRTMYLQAARTPLMQLRRVPEGDAIEEDHMRNRQLIVNWIMEKNGSIARVERNGKFYYTVRDFMKMREAVGALLAELMRIKAEGDYAAAKALVDKYGVHFDPKLRDQVVARFNRLELPTYWAGINPELNAKWGPDGKVAKVIISYPRDVVRQQLGYAAMYER